MVFGTQFFIAHARTQERQPDTPGSFTGLIERQRSVQDALQASDTLDTFKALGHLLDHAGNEVVPRIQQHFVLCPEVVHDRPGGGLQFTCYLADRDVLDPHTKNRSPRGLQHLLALAFIVGNRSARLASGAGRGFSGYRHGH
ncbi:hypothetical protein D3C76_1398370 [compost metagenome]